MLRERLVVLLFSVIHLSKPCLANVGDAFGFGSRTQALAGIGSVLTSDAFAAYHNPAGLSLLQSNTPDENHLLLSVGMLYMQPKFLPISQTLVQNNFNADGSKIDSVDTSYQPTFGQQLAIAYQFFPKTYRLTLGLATFFPAEHLANMDTGESYVPEYVLYRSRTQRPQFEMGLGLRLIPDLYVGVGAHVAYSLSSNGYVFINTKPSTVSSMRFAAQLKPKVAPFFSVLYAPENGKDFSMGAVLRLPVKSDNEVVLNTAARLFGDFAAIDFNFNAYSTLFYDPLAIELGGSWQHSSRGRLYLQLDYQQWGKFQAPALLIEQAVTTQCEAQGSGTCPKQIAPGILPSYQYSDLIIPRIAEELLIAERTTLRLGYAYRGSILSQVPDGNGNYLDPPKHMLNAGLGLEFEKFFHLDLPSHLDFNFAFQWLVRQSITKTPGNESGDLTDNKIGYPGYEAGGCVYGGGISLSLLF